MGKCLTKSAPSARECSQIHAPSTSAKRPTASGIAGVALSYLVFQRTNSALWLVGTLFFSFGVVGLLTPFAGKLVDRYDRPRVMIVSDLGSPLTWSLLAFTREPLAIAAIGFVASVLAVPVKLAANAAVPNLVEEDDLTWAERADRGRRERRAPRWSGDRRRTVCARRATLAFVVNAASFGVSALLVPRSVIGRSRPSQRGRNGAVARSRAFRVTRRDRLLLWITVRGH